MRSVTLTKATGRVSPPSGRKGDHRRWWKELAIIANLKGMAPPAKGGRSFYLRQAGVASLQRIVACAGSYRHPYAHPPQTSRARFAGAPGRVTLPSRREAIARAAALAKYGAASIPSEEEITAYFAFKITPTNPGLLRCFFTLLGGGPGSAFFLTFSGWYCIIKC